jgi:hypothetical protein
MIVPKILGEHHIFVVDLDKWLLRASNINRRHVFKSLVLLG